LKIVLTLKSFFKLHKGTQKKSRKKDTIHVKGISLFLLFSKSFFKNCKIKIFFPKSQKSCLVFLKAPSRHKKFFHETVFEKYKVNIIYNVLRFNRSTFKYETVILSNFFIINLAFLKLNKLFDLFGSNTLTKCKFRVSVKFPTTIY